MNLLKKFVSAVSAAALAVTALTSVYAPLSYAEEYPDADNAVSSVTSENTAASADAEYTAGSALNIADLRAGSKADFTVMVYMVGSNLESEGGLATEDIKEMCKGFTGSKVNVIIQTGGSTKWEYSGISSKKCQRFQVTSKGLKLVDDSLGQQDMSSKNTLCNFIKFCKKKYAAKRYGLILWDHGGGTIGGFGQDDNYSGSAMSLVDYQSALSKGGVHFDFVGFDACLMATLETALLTAEYADYLIGAEDISSGIGWYYTDWIRNLCKNPKVSTSGLGKNIADSSVKKCVSMNKNSSDEISVIKLDTVVSTVLPALNTFSKNSLTLLEAKKYSTVAKKRSQLSIYSDYYELVDISKYASAFADESLVSKSAATLKAAVKKAVVYRKAAGISAGMGGLSFAFPFSDLENLDTVREIYDVADCDTVYPDFLVRFANIMAGGQQYHLGSDEKYNYSACDWYDEKQFYPDNYYSRFYLGTANEDLHLQTINGQKVFPISADMDEVISSYELCMLTVERKGTSTIITDYGTDNIADLDDYGNLIVDFDRTWVSLNGKPVTCYYDYTASNGKYRQFVSYVYGEYNGQDALIYLMWDNRNYFYPDNGIVVGWAPIEDDGGVTRRYYVNNGDKFRVYYVVSKSSKTYFSLDKTVYTIGKTKVTYEDVSKLGDIVICYKITDIFNNVYYTEMVWC